MSLLSVKTWVAAQLNAAPAVTANTTQFTSVDAFAQLPKRDKLGSNLVIVVGPVDRTENRLSGPRGGGRKEFVYAISLLLYATGADSTLVGNDFDTVVENAIQVFRSVNLSPAPVITDAQTGATSYLTYVSEEAHVQMLEPQLTADQGRIEFRAVVQITVREVFIAGE